MQLFCTIMSVLMVRTVRNIEQMRCTTAGILDYEDTIMVPKEINKILDFSKFITQLQEVTNIWKEVAKHTTAEIEKIKKVDFEDAEIYQTDGRDGTENKIFKKIQGIEKNISTLKDSSKTSKIIL